MLVKPKTEDLLKKVDNRYELVIAVSRRGRQIINGSDPMVKYNDDEITTINMSSVDKMIAFGLDTLFLNLLRKAWWTQIMTSIAVYEMPSKTMFGCYSERYNFDFVVQIEAGDFKEAMEIVSNTLDEYWCRQLSKYYDMHYLSAVQHELELGDIKATIYEKVR